MAIRNNKTGFQPWFERTRLLIILHLAAAFPGLLMIWDSLAGNLSFNPIQDLTLRTGKVALILLVLALAVTPFHTVFHYPPIIRLRKWLGLWAFFYVLAHFLIFVWLDYGLDLVFIYQAIFEKPFALVGFLAFLILLPLAITSTDGWKRRLRKNWKRLHRLVYAANILAVIHYTWAVKSDIREPLLYGLVVALLLGIRTPIGKSFLRFRSRRLKNIA